MNDIKIKTYCAVCDCMVVTEGHEARCRPKTVKGWDTSRQLAWVGDSVHRVDVQLAIQFQKLPPAQWEFKTQAYTSNAAQALYMRALTVSAEGRSAHSLGTEFEASYSSLFRIRYLRQEFPTVAELVLAAWQPPSLGSFQE